MEGVRHRPESNLEQDTAGGLASRHELVERAVDHLACGDIMVEPTFGEVRIVQATPVGYDEQHGVPLVQVTWIEDGGLSSAARAYPANTAVAVRVPAWQDRAAIRRGIDAAIYHGREISPATVRLIAAHLHSGPGSALYAFAVSGEITDRLYRELDEAALSQKPYVLRWVEALTRYCHNRGDPGPLPGWAAERW